MCWDIHLLGCHFLTVKMFRIFSLTAALSVTTVHCAEECQNLPASSCHFVHTDTALSGTPTWAPQQCTCEAHHIQYTVTRPVSSLAAVKWHVGSTCGWLYTRVLALSSTLSMASHRHCQTGEAWLRDSMVPTTVLSGTIQSRPDECFSHHLELRHKNLWPSWFFKKRETEFKTVKTERSVLKTFCLCALLLFHLCGSRGLVGSSFPTEPHPPLPGCPQPTAQHTRLPWVSFFSEDFVCVCV